MWGKVIEALILAVLAIEVAATLLSLMATVRNISITVNEVNNTYTTRICLSNVTPINVTITVIGASATIKPGEHGCLTVNSTSLLNNVTLGVGLFNITLGIGYAK